MDTDRNHPQQEILVEAEDLEKIYPLFFRKTDRIREAFSFFGRPHHREFRALSAEGNAWGSSAGTEPENPRF